jgi:sugar phosphate permease
MSLAEKPHHTEATLDDSKTHAGAEKVPLDHGSAQSEENVGQMLTGPQFTAAQTKKLLRRCDKYLLPFLALLYLLSFLDRTNIGNAKLANLEVDLKMTGKWDYNIAVSVFFPFYVAAEIPSNLAMKRFRPSIWIPSIMVAWAIMTILLGVVHNFAGLIAVRCALGIAEGGLFPGITYYITLWYRRHECGFRMAIFFSAATAAGAFGGLLARGIMEMSGVGGKGGWAWIFILEGLLTLIVALAAYKVMYDYPATAKFLSAEEKQEIVLRLEHDRSGLSDAFDLKYMKHAFADWKIWVHMFITIGIYTPLYSISIFLPSIVKGMGYTNETAQLMTVPPYVAGCICCISCGYFADKMGKRGIFMIGNCLLAMLGFAILTGVRVEGVKYMACFFIVMGVYSNVPQGVAWNGNNIGGSVKRGVGIAMHVGFGNLGGAIAGFIYRASDAPHYVSGHAILLGTETMSCILAICMHLYLRRENARRDRENKPVAEYTREDMMLEQDKGDNATFFRYTL